MLNCTLGTKSDFSDFMLLEERFDELHKSLLPMSKTGEIERNLQAIRDDVGRKAESKELDECYNLLFGYFEALRGFVQARTDDGQTADACSGPGCAAFVVE